MSKLTDGETKKLQGKLADITNIITRYQNDLAKKLITGLSNSLADVLKPIFELQTQEEAKKQKAEAEARITAEEDEKARIKADEDAKAKKQLEQVQASIKGIQSGIAQIVTTVNEEQKKQALAKQIQDITSQIAGIVGQAQRQAAEVDRLRLEEEERKRQEEEDAKKKQAEEADKKQAEDEADIKRQEDTDIKTSPGIQPSTSTQIQTIIDSLSNVYKKINEQESKKSISAITNSISSVLGKVVNAAKSSPPPNNSDSSSNVPVDITTPETTINNLSSNIEKTVGTIINSAPDRQVRGLITQLEQTVGKVVKPSSTPSSTNSVPETVVKELGEVLAKLMKNIPSVVPTTPITPTTITPTTPTTTTSSAFVVSDDTDAIVKIMDGTSTTTIPIVIPE
jgi:hypothetical protein